MKTSIFYFAFLVANFLRSIDTRHFHGIKHYIEAYGGRYQPQSVISFKQSRLCTAVNDGGPPYRYHKPTRRCYVVGERGPCGEMMEFTMVDRNYGACDCSQKLRCGRPLIYWKQKDRCYFINEQGPCISGKWLVFSLYRTPVCKRNICQQEMRRNPSRGANFWFEHGGKCYRTGSQGYCSVNETLINDWRDYRPKCSSNEYTINCYDREVHRTDCLPGQKLDRTEACIKIRLMTTYNTSEPNLDRIPPKVYHLMLQ